MADVVATESVRFEKSAADTVSSNDMKVADEKAATPSDDVKVAAAQDAKAPASPHINLMFVDVNMQMGRISEIAYCVITSNTEAASKKKKDPILLEVLERTRYKYIEDSILVIKPDGFVSQTPGHEFGADIADVIRDIVELLPTCQHCFAPEDNVFKKIQEEAQRLITAKKLQNVDVMPLYHIEKTTFVSSAHAMLECIGMRATAPGITFSLGNLYQGLFKDQLSQNKQLPLVLDAYDLSKQLDKMVSCFLHLIGKGGVIYLDGETL